MTLLGSIAGHIPINIRIGLGKTSEAVARALEKGGTYVGRMGGVERLFRRMSKDLQVMTAVSPIARDTGERLYRMPWALEKNFLGEPTIASAEMKYKATRDVTIGTGIETAKEAYSKYKTRLRDAQVSDPATIAIIQEHKNLAGKMGIDAESVFKGRDYLTYAEVLDEAGRARNRNTAEKSFVHPIPEVNAIAKYYGDEFESLLERGIKSGELNKAIENDPNYVKSYLTHLYKTDLIRDHRAHFVDLVARNQGINHIGDLKKAQEGLAKIQQRVDSIVAQGKNPSEALLARLEKKQKSVEGFEKTDLTKIANDITNNILSSPYGTQHLDPEGVGLARSQKERKLYIHASLLSEFEPYLDTNIERVFAMYTHSMLPRFILRETFGTGSERNLTEVLDNATKKIEEDYNTIQGDPTVTKQETRFLEAERRRVLRYLKASFDEFIGLKRLPSDSAALSSRLSRGILQLSLLRSLGGVTVHSIPDAARHAARFGLQDSMAGLGQIINHWDISKLGLDEVKGIAGIHEMQLGQRMLETSELYQNVVPYQSSIERFMDKSTHWFGHIVLLNPWNQSNKQFAGFLAMNWWIKDARTIAQGGTIPEKRLARLAEAGLGAEDMKKIWGEFEKFGYEEHGIHVAQTSKWTDRDLAEKFGMAIKREADLTSLTPGLGDRPFMGMFEPVSRHLLQFRSFSLSAVNAIFLSGLQYRDAQVLNGILLGVTTGAFVYYLDQMKYHRRTGEIPKLEWNEILANAIDRSGILGFISDSSAVVERVSRGTIGINPLLGASRVSRFKSLDAVNLILGPTVGLGRDLASVSGAIATREWNDSDVSAFRRSIPFNNLEYMVWLFNRLEAGMKKTMVNPVYRGGSYPSQRSR